MIKCTVWLQPGYSDEHYIQLARDKKSVVVKTQVLQEML